jgi:hypothetical protein
MSRKALFILSLFMIFFSCNCENTKDYTNLEYTVIDVGSDIGKGRVVDFSEIASEITYIPLESKAEAFIGIAPVVFYENDRFYIRSSGSIKMFDRKGKYLYTFNRKGRGPQEYEWGVPWVEKGSGGFYIEDRKVDCKVIKIYDRDGNFKKEISVPQSEDMFSKLNRYATNCFISRLIPRVYKDNREYFAVMFDTLSNIRGFVPTPPIDPRLVKSKKAQNTSLPKNVELMYSPDQLDVGYVLHTFKDSIRVYTLYGDTIYSYRDSNTLFPRYVLDYGHYTPSKIYIDQDGDAPPKQITLDNGFYFETDKYLLLYFRLGYYAHEPYYGKKAYLLASAHEYTIRHAIGYFNKITNKFTLMNQPTKGMLGFRDDFEQGPPFVPMYLSGDNCIVTAYYPQTLIEYASKHKVSGRLQQLIDGLNENDNLVIAIAKLK